jgi:prevent-host-death family protein
VLALTLTIRQQEGPVTTWPVQDAKAKFSEMLETCLQQGPQVVSKRGVDAAVLVPIEQWRKLQKASHPTLKEFLLGDGPRGELNVPPRGRLLRRAPPSLD